MQLKDSVIWCLFCEIIEILLITEGILYDCSRGFSVPFTKLVNILIASRSELWCIHF
jgi:hypothetical protein